MFLHDARRCKQNRAFFVDCFGDSQDRKAVSKLHSLWQVHCRQAHGSDGPFDDSLFAHDLPHAPIISGVLTATIVISDQAYKSPILWQLSEKNTQPKDAVAIRATPPHAMFSIVYDLETILNGTLAVNDYVTTSGQVVEKSMDKSLTTRSEKLTHLMTNSDTSGAGFSPKTPIPSWVPESVQRYLTHTQAGLPIREVARRTGCHASTVLRQIRKIEVRRDDPLVDRALHLLSSKFFHGTPSFCAKERSEMSDMPNTKGFKNDCCKYGSANASNLAQIMRGGICLGRRRGHGNGSCCA